ncbi:MFS transporter [Agromyces bauzanensis]|uniref:MFS transporter n=1 Tax=Agromyces bauzanensis TaxID=1308924 RepID=A0A917PJ10_9MICO|nr:MFS transporter [Agromyces bauzanensis]GGJ79864.1 MFS transporter [Agromyces bauzanensis]
MSTRGGDERASLSRTPPTWPIVAVLAFAGACSSFMFTIVVPIQAELPELLGESREATAWVLTVTLLTAAVTTPIAGRLGDLYGKRRIVLALIAVLVVGSVIAGASQSLPVLLVGRALQGAVVGVIPLGIAILRDHLHEDQIGGAVALVSATLGFGGALGLPVSALIAGNSDWHLLFWMAAALGVVLFALVSWLVPVSTLRAPGRFDLPGAIGLAIGLSGLLVALSQGDAWGWTSAGTLGFGLGGIVVLVVWGLFELRLDDPLVDLRVAARPPVLITNLASIAMGFAFFSSNITLPQLLELPAGTGVGLGLSLLAASLVVMPAGLVMMAMSPVAARLTRRFGAKALLVSGAGAMVVAYTVAVVASSEVWQIALVNALIGVGIGLGYAAMPILIMHAVPATETGAANGLNALMRSLGTSMAAAVMGAVLAATAVDVDGVLVPTRAAFDLTFLIGLAAAIVAGGLGLAIPKPRRLPGEHPSLPDDVA